MTLGIRIKEHFTQKTSAVHAHTQKTGHIFNKDNIKIITKEEIKDNRKVKEAIEIRQAGPDLNRDDGNNYQQSTTPYSPADGGSTIRHVTH